MGWQTNENVTNYYKQKLAQIDTPPSRPQVWAVCIPHSDTIHCNVEHNITLVNVQYLDCTSAAESRSTRFQSLWERCLDPNLQLGEKTTRASNCCTSRSQPTQTKCTKTSRHCWWGQQHSPGTDHLIPLRNCGGWRRTTASVRGFC